MQKLNRQELIEVVTKICNGEYDNEKQRSELMRIFENNVPYQDVYFLIHEYYDKLTPEGIVEKALAHKPFIIELGGPKYTEEELSRKDKK